MYLDFLTLLVCIMPIILLSLPPITFLKHYFMNKLIVIEVSMRTLNPKEPFKKVFSRQKEVSSDLCFPYEMVVNTLSYLFGQDSVVSVSTYNEYKK